MGRLRLIGCAAVLLAVTAVPTEADALICDYVPYQVSPAYMDGAGAGTVILQPAQDGLIALFLAGLGQSYSHTVASHYSNGTALNQQWGHADAPVIDDGYSGCSRPLHAVEFANMRPGYLARQKYSDAFWSAQGYKSKLGWRDGYAVSNRTASCPYQASNTCNNVGCRYSPYDLLGHHTTGTQNVCSEFLTHRCGVSAPHGFDTDHVLSQSAASAMWHQLVDVVTDDCIANAPGMSWIARAICGHGRAVSCNKAAYQVANGTMLNRNSSGYDFNSSTWALPKLTTHTTPDDLGASGISGVVTVKPPVMGWRYECRSGGGDGDGRYQIP